MFKLKPKLHLAKTNKKIKTESEAKNRIREVAEVKLLLLLRFTLGTKKIHAWT